MTTRFSYSFSLTQPKPKVHAYDYTEFLLTLPLHWKQIPNAEEGQFNFRSDELNATITVSCDFYAIPDDKQLRFAEKNLESRLAALERVASSAVVIQRTIKPHSGGAGLELSFVADVPGEYVYLYLGYVTSRKVLNFTLVCPPGWDAAAALFNELVPDFRPLLP